MKRIKTAGRVVVAGCVAKERFLTVRRVVGAGCVASKRTRTVGRVVLAGCVAKERFKTDGRVVEALDGDAKESVVALSGVLVGIATVRCRSDRLSRGRKRK